MLAARTCHVSPLSPAQVPLVHEAVHLRESSNMGLTRESIYGVDPLVAGEGLFSCLLFNGFLMMYMAMEKCY